MVIIIGLITNFLLFVYSVIKTHSLEYAYLVVNISLALVPLLLSTRLVIVLKHKLWSAWEPLILTLIWILFLPNSFYMVSDFIHLQNMSNSSILYNAVMFTSFIYLAVLMGLISLYQVHRELIKRLHTITAGIIVVILMFSCCFAIYLGRDLRWNSWDLVVNPGGLLFDISNLILRPSTYPDMGRTILSFFVLLGSSYLIAWQSAQLMWHKGVSDLATHMRREKNRESDLL